MMVAATSRQPGHATSGLPRALLHALKKLPASGRASALAALLLVEAGRNAQEALADVLRPVPGGNELSAADRHLCSELVYGCLRTELRLAHILGKVLPNPQRLPRPMLLLLHQAVYAMLFQERVPDHAAVHSAVELANRLFGRKLAGVVNGALRSVQRLGKDVLLPDFYVANGKGSAQAEWEGLCRYYSMPVWLADVWLAAYGREAALALMRRSFERPWGAVRINARHGSAIDLRAALLACEGSAAVGDWGVAFAPGALPEGALGQSIAFWQEQGGLSFQSAGSQVVLHELGLSGWQGPVWDACAGYGGKSAALLERGVGVALSSDCAFARLRHVPELCRRLRLPVPCVCLADAGKPPLARWPGPILVDAPCSGLGVLARRPDIRRGDRRGPKQLAQLAELQFRLLGALASRLAPGQELAYLTCTLNPQENERLVARMLGQRPELQAVRQWQTPHEHPWLEGMYGALLVRL